VSGVIVAAFIASLKVAEILVLVGTPVAPFAGLVEVTVGMLAVVKVQTKLLASALPAGSLAPVVIVPVNLMLGARLLAGVNVAVVPEAVTVPGRGVPLGPAMVKVTVLSVVGFITLLKVAVMTWVTGTAAAPFVGFVETTKGAMNPDCSRPHPAMKTPRRNAKNHILLTLDIRISVSSSICNMAFFSTITQHSFLKITDSKELLSVGYPTLARIAISIRGHPRTVE